MEARGSTDPAHSPLTRMQPMIGGQFLRGGVTVGEAEVGAKQLR